MHYVVIPWKDRTPYLRITLATLFEAARGRGDVEIIIFNNASVDDLPKIAHRYHSQGSPGIRIHRLPVTDCHYNYVNMLNEAFNTVDTDYIITQDSDACIHPDFFNVADRAIDEIPDLGHFSFFNEDCHPEPTSVYKGIYHNRKHISFFSTIISRKAWEMFPIPNFGDPMKGNCMDGNISLFINEQTPYRVCSTIRSYAEHIGMEGKHVIKLPDKEIIARARRFYA